MKPFFLVTLILFLQDVIAPSPKGTKYGAPEGGRKIPGNDFRGERHRSADTFDRQTRLEIEDRANERADQQGPCSADTYPVGSKSST